MLVNHFVFWSYAQRPTLHKAINIFFPVSHKLFHGFAVVWFIECYFFQYEFCQFHLTHFDLILSTYIF
jgi:hypothetical protein